MVEVRVLAVGRRETVEDLGAALTRSRVVLSTRANSHSTPSVGPAEAAKSIPIARSFHSRVRGLGRRGGGGTHEPRGRGTRAPDHRADVRAAHVPVLLRNRASHSCEVTGSNGGSRSRTAAWTRSQDAIAAGDHVGGVAERHPVLGELVLVVDPHPPGGPADHVEVEVDRAQPALAVDQTAGVAMSTYTSHGRCGSSP